MRERYWERGARTSTVTSMSKANIILLTATTQNAASLAEFLSVGAKLVADTEPETARWHALTREDRAGEMAIFDVFPSQAGRQAHFDGQVAAALSERAGELVVGGWAGVLANNSNLVTLAEHRVEDGGERVARKATMITLRARAGKAEELRALLVGGCELVAQTEPNTLYWTALESEDQRGEFRIFDLFADEAGRAEHFAGKVAAALCERAAELVEGGWEQGVLAKVSHFEVGGSVERDRC